MEYALLVALIGVVCIGATSFLSTRAEEKFVAVGEAMREPGNQDPGGGGGGGGPGPSDPSASSTTSTTGPTSVASATFGDVRSWSSGWYRWEGSAEVGVTDASGRPLAGARVEVRVVVPGGTTRTVTVTTDSRGAATVEVGPYASWGETDHARLEVVGVVAEGSTWDGAGGAVTIPAP